MTYNMPPDTSSKEKIIGGILDFTQLIYILIGIAIGIILGLFFKLFFGIFGTVIGLIPGIIFALAFCFYKKEDLSLMNYIKYKNKHKVKTKLLPNIRKECLTNEEIQNIRNFKETKK